MRLKNKLVCNNSIFFSLKFSSSTSVVLLQTGILMSYDMKGINGHVIVM